MLNSGSKLVLSSCLSFPKSKPGLALLCLALVALGAKGGFVLSDEKFSGIYNEEDSKVDSENFIFNQGFWIVFNSPTSNGRIMEYHPKSLSFVKKKHLSCVTSIGFFEPSNMVIAFYADKTPEPRKTLITGMDKALYKVSKKEACKLVERMQAQNDGFLALINQVPLFKAKEVMKTNPFPLLKFWESIQDNVEDEYLASPYSQIPPLDESTLRAIYKDVSVYFAMITFFPGPTTWEDREFREWVGDGDDHRGDKEFKEDLLRPFTSLTSASVMDHLSKEFTTVMEYYATLAKEYVIQKLFFSDFGLRDALRHSGGLDAMMHSFSNPNGSFSKNFNWKSVYAPQAFELQTASKGKMVLLPKTGDKVNLSHQMWLLMQEVYNHGKSSYHNFVQWRGKINNGNYFKPKEINQKAGVDVMEHVFRYFKKHAFPGIVDQVAAKFLEALRDSEVLKEANFEDIENGGEKHMDVLKKQMKMLGYLAYNSSENTTLLDYFPFEIFKAGRRALI